MGAKAEEVFVPHVGWFLHEPEDDVGAFLNEGWFEYREQAFVWLYARPGDVFIDCGAHFGLYSGLYGSAAGEPALVLAIEPNPSTLAFLRRNLALRKGSPARVLRCAVSDAEGTASFYRGRAGKAAYSGLVKPYATATPDLDVPIRILDRICAEYGIGLADFVKLDVEGAEIAAIRGAAASIAKRMFPILMVEFTEQNLQRCGSTTKELYTELASRGYTVCRFNEQTLQLEPVEHTGPVWYDNYFAIFDLHGVNTRLRTASSNRRRIARDIVRRGQIADRMRSSETSIRAEANQRAEEAIRLLNEDRLRADEANRRAEDALKLLSEAYARGGEANWRADEANRRADEALKLLNDSYVRAGEANWRSDEANRRIEDALRLLNEAYARGGEANWRADEANRRAEDAVRLLNDAYARADEANRRADEANGRAEDALRLLNEASARTDEANRRADEAIKQERRIAAELATSLQELKKQLATKHNVIRSYQASLVDLKSRRYVRLGHKLHLLPKIQIASDCED